MGRSLPSSSWFTLSPLLPCVAPLYRRVHTEARSSCNQSHLPSGADPHREPLPFRSILNDPVVARLGRNTGAGAAARPRESAAVWLHGRFCDGPSRFSLQAGAGRTFQVPFGRGAGAPEISFTNFVWALPGRADPSPALICHWYAAHGGWGLGH